MPTVDPVADIESALWDAIEASTEVEALVNPAGYSKTGKGWIQDRRNRKAPADFPRIEITSTADRRDNDQGQTFGMRDTSKDVDYGIPVTVNFDLVVWYDPPMMDLESQRELESEIQASIYALGVTLGLPWVQSWSSLTGSRKVENIQHDSTERVKWTWPISVKGLPYLSQLT